MQQNITQQLQHTMNLCQQVVQELQQINQAVQSTGFTAGYQSGATAGNQGYGAPSQFSGGSSSIQAVMQADRQVDRQESTPSYRNYNTQTPAYSPSQSVNYNSQVNPAGIQAVMQADRFAADDGRQFGSGYTGGYASATQGRFGY